MMYKNLLRVIIVVTCTLVSNLLYAQTGMSGRYIRVAEVGELADSINVWGDVGTSGRFIVPEDTKLPELISFSFGYTQLGGREANINWAKTQIEVKVSRYNRSKKLVGVAFFRYKYRDPEPVEMFEFDLQNNDIVTLQVRRKPSLTDYVNVVAPVLSLAATSFLLIENLLGNR
ncbi:hypothetical protein NC796_14545 [Aliifodinibius sp. S!AR15-10]|uniref:hypothetical protein n=1 Tax=Aliifodinibius sp. S!AR15-10 TaxID=2950437 RepID=UPI0028650EAB|nr:hypothetical protein [Aliifodinibius sp. S!AR15-10]MDR8392370.1 hypothetical protein [Aliifodinibius sp. S!AR15-10]